MTSPGNLARTALMCCAIFLMPGVASFLAHGTAIQPPNVSTAALVAAAADYVGRYQQAFAFLLADEATVQHVVSRSSRTGGEQTDSRITKGELFLTYLEAQKHWTAVRDVTEADGLTVRDREDLSRLIANEEIGSLARRLFALNARHNIGRVVRNFNDPMLALLPLNGSHRSRFAFAVANVDRGQPGLTQATLRFRERERPTLVRSTSGRPVYASGEITLDAATGIVRRTRITMNYDGIDAALSTDFVPEERLGLWVPQLFVERYSSTREGRTEITTCESRYSNYRRFEATGRLLEVVGTPQFPNQ